MVTHQIVPDDRLLRALAEQLKLPLLQIARQAELGIDGATSSRGAVVSQTADMALSLIDGFLLSTDIYAQQMLELEPVAVSSVLYAVSQDLKSHALLYDCDIDVSLSGKYAPVMGSFNALRLAFTTLGAAFIDAQPNDAGPKRIILAAHSNAKGIVAGIFGSQPGLSSDMYKRAKALYGTSKQPLASTFSNASAGVFVADSLFSTVATPLKVSSHNKLSGLATTLLPSKQLQLV